MSQGFLTPFVLGSVVWFAAAGLTVAEVPTAQLAENGRANLPIVTSPQASQRVRDLAATLADYLQRISGAKFQVKEGDGRGGIAVGTAEQFPHLDLAGRWTADGFGADEQYLLRSHPGGLYVFGAGETAVQHAVWDLLGRLGYRHFFPGEKWEVIPATGHLEIAVDIHEKPDYVTRLIWYGFGTWDYNDEPLARWREHNRVQSTFTLNTGHAYDRILSQYKAEFKAHPEYLGLLAGERKSTKFCVSNPGLRTLVVRYADEFFKAQPDANSVSIDPSDGGGWCECDACRAMGPPSNRALTLANKISALLEDRYPGKYVGMYAYNEHSPPPSIQARPRVIVSTATAFIRGGLSIDEIIEGWKRQGVRQFGIREYYSVNTWDRDLPAAARGSNLEYLARTIPQFHGQGARFMSSESSDNWGPNGLGYYLATRMLWDVDEAKRVDALVADFLDKAFGPARGPMAKFYKLLDGAQPPLMSRDLIGRMYRLLDESSKLAGDAKIQARLDDLVLYARYVELFRRYANAKGDGRQAAFEQLIRHAYRMRTSMMVHTLALYRDLANRDKAVSIPEGAGWNVPEGKNPWKTSEPFRREELDRITADGIAANPVIRFSPVAHSEKLVLPTPLHLPDSPPLDDTQRGRGRQVFWTWFDAAPGELELEVTGGLIAHYRDRGNVRLELYSVCDGKEKLVAHDASAPPDGKPYEVTLHSDRAGLHKLVVNDGSDMTEILWPAGLPRTIKLDEDATVASGRRSGYFYVPRGTRHVGGYATPAPGAVIRDSRGKAVFDSAELDGPDYFQAEVPAGEDGKLWSLRGANGRVALLTVPPYLARSPGELLLPEEVVKADAERRQ
ncbi:MAG: DUF4838 domain-containing protein [Pirellulales bacterium]|nr:DUF4838 domain-containing protein [Pirellulales bacterium]